MSAEVVSDLIIIVAGLVFSSVCPRLSTGHGVMVGHLAKG